MAEPSPSVVSAEKTDSSTQTDSNTKNYSNTKILFYDIPREDPLVCWSLNTWKTRLALNFKGVDYETKWVEYPDIAPLLESLSTPPNLSPRGPKYTLPAISFLTSPTAEKDEAQTQKVTIQDSLLIAAALEARFPSPPMRVDDPVVAEVQKAVSKVFRPLFTLITPLPTLSSASAPYFAAKDARAIALHGPDPVGEEAWTQATQPIHELAEQIEGPFVRGTEVSYADFVVGGVLRHVWRCGGPEVLERLVGMDASGRVAGVRRGLVGGGWFGRED